MVVDLIKGGGGREAFVLAISGPTPRGPNQAVVRVCVCVDYGNRILMCDYRIALLG